MKSDDEKCISSLHTKRRSNAADKATFYKGMGIASFFVSLCLVFALMFLSLKPKTEIPYVIEINAEGDARYVSDAVSTLSKWEPSKTTIMNTLKDYIVALRGVSKDSGIEEERIKRVYAFSTSSASKVTSAYFKETSPMERLKEEYVKVDVYAITPMLNNSENVYQLDFNEKTYTLLGTLKNEQNYRAIINIEFFRPRTKSMQESNPLGVYVKDIEISKIKDGYVVL